MVSTRALGQARSFARVRDSVIPRTRLTAGLAKSPRRVAGPGVFDRYGYTATGFGHVIS